MNRPDYVPQDVWCRARILAAQYGGTGLVQQLAEEISAAILAERQRCARVAEGALHDGLTAARVSVNVARSVIAAIRTGAAHG